MSEVKYASKLVIQPVYYQAEIKSDSSPVKLLNNLIEKSINLALEEQQRLTKDLEDRRARAEQDRLRLEKERLDAEKKASQIADIANEEKEKMVSLHSNLIIIKLFSLWYWRKQV